MRQIIILIIAFVWTIDSLDLKVKIDGPSIVKAGDDIDLICKYELGSELLYSTKWYIGENEFYRFMPNDKPSGQVFALPGINVDILESNDRKLRLKNMSMVQSLKFRCEVSTEAPSFDTASAEKIVHVIGAPDSVKDCTVTQHSVSSFMIECNEQYDGGISQTFFLEVYNSKLEKLVSNVTSTKPVFLIQNLTPNTMYSLTIYSANSIGRSREVIIFSSTLKEAKSQYLEITSIEVPSMVYSGDDVDLVCNFHLKSDTLYSVKWYRNGVEFYRFLPDNRPNKLAFKIQGVNVNVLQSSDRNVHLVNVSEQSTGEYRCEVSTTDTFKTAHALKSMLVLRKDSSLQAQNIFGRNDQTVVNGNVASFECKAITNTDIQIQWTKNGKPLTKLSSRYTIIKIPNGSLLRIEPVSQLRDNGSYECYKNISGDLEQIESVNLKVIDEDEIPKEFPKITLQPQTRIVESGKSALITCQVENNSQTSVTWMKNMVPVDMSNARYSMYQGTSLRIKNAIESDQGHYECVAHNKFGSIHSNPAALYVKSRVVLPFFTVIPKELYEVEVGSNLDITCEADGSQPPRVIWKNDQLEMAPQRNEAVTRSVLLLRNIRESSNYTCIASTSLGVISYETSVVVKSAQFHQTNEQEKELELSSLLICVKSITSDSIWLAWNQIESVEEYKAVISKSNDKCIQHSIDTNIQVYSIVNSTELHIKNLTQSTNYIVELSATTTTDPRNIKLMFTTMKNNFKINEN